MDGGEGGSQAAKGTAGQQQKQPKQPSAQSSRDPSPVLKRDALSQSHASRRPSSTNLVASLPPSMSASPQNSRNTSPIRPSARQQDTPKQDDRKSDGLRSRKNSTTNSPIRTAPLSTSSTGPPSAAAIQRALSATNIPQLQPAQAPAGPVSEAIGRLPRPSKTAPASEAATPVSPGISPRLKSPGPSAPASRRNSLPLKKSENGAAPGIVVQASTPPASAVEANKPDTASEPRSQPLQTPKLSNRGPSGPKTSLETVQEATPPARSVLSESTDQSFHSKNSSHSTKSSDEERSLAGTIPIIKKDNVPEDRGRAEDGENDAKPNPKLDQAKAKSTLPRSGPSMSRTRQGDGTRNMTVETETVASIPQAAIATDRPSQRDTGGSLRLKPSNETIRPRKERRRPTRKAPSIHNGTASSKADIFEARVASAVDEANSSDSDETFVYESNPPEPSMRANRHHSRTPSVTSTHSQSDHRGLRAYENHRVAGKRSMKFSNNPYNVLDSPTEGESGTIRAHHPRNIARFGRTVGSNSSLYDPESQQAQAAKLRQGLAGGMRSPRPSTPKSGTGRAMNPWGRKFDGAGPNYDFDGEGADDERMPLMGTVRTPRHRQSRRYNSGRYEDIYNLRESSFLGRFGGCLLVSTVLILLVFGAISFLFMSNKSLGDVRINTIQNVLATEGELMLDMSVSAINPNVMGVAIMDLDIDLFAKSKHLATTTSSTIDPTATPTPVPSGFLVQRHGSPVSVSPARGQVSALGAPWQDKDGRWHDGDDDDDDDDDSNPEGDSQTMLLGRVFQFDQGLYFEGSPLRRSVHSSVGELRLTKPGNKTEAGGSERWERVLQQPFELIVRGVLRYTLPVSGRSQTAAIRGRVLVNREGSEADELLARAIGGG